MIILTVKFETNLSEKEAYQLAEERLPQFQEVPGPVPEVQHSLFIRLVRKAFITYRAACAGISSILRYYRSERVPCCDVEIYTLSAHRLGGGCNYL